MLVFPFMKKFLTRYGRYLLRGGGIVGICVSVFFLVSGIYFLCQNSTTKDKQDFFSTWDFEVQSDSRAIVLEPDGIEFDGQWDMGEIGLFKVLVDMNNSEKDLFIGAALEEDVRSCVNGTEYDKITALWIFPARADYQRFSGDKILADPALLGFWIEPSYGEGTNGLIWNPEHDNTSLIIMNADGSLGLDLNVQVKTMVGILFIAGAINLMVGVFLLLLSLLAILYSGRASNTVYPGPLRMFSRGKKKQEASP